MAWRRQATNHYLNQCWPISPTPYGVTRPQWVNKLWGLFQCILVYSLSKTWMPLIASLTSDLYVTDTVVLSKCRLHGNRVTQRYRFSHYWLPDISINLTHHLRNNHPSTRTSNYTHIMLNTFFAQTLHTLLIEIDRETERFRKGNKYIWREVTLDVGYFFKTVAWFK